MFDILEKLPKLKKKKQTKLEFVPVIFANGEDDDIPGLVAALTNEKVQFKDKIYKENEDLIIDHEKLLLTRNLYICGYGQTPEPLDLNYWIVVIQPEVTRHVTITNCLLISGR